MKKIFISFFVFLFISISSFVYADETIKIASWNIENFGQKKASNQGKMALIATILSQFDLIAVQEISNVLEKSDPGCDRNEDKCPGNNKCNLILNALKKNLTGKDNKNYEFIFSPQIKDERYLFIYDKNKIQALDSGQVVVDEGDDPSKPICDRSAKGNMLRQPFYVTFKAGNFDFTLLTAHTSPNRNIQELQALAVFYWKVQSIDSNQNDVILLGDLNADGDYLSESLEIELRKPEYNWIVDNTDDTTVGDSNRAYDRMIFTETTKEDYTGNYGVFRFDDEFDLSKETAGKISDHYPIWAEFYTDKDTDHKVNE